MTRPMSASSPREDEAPRNAEPVYCRKGFQMSPDASRGRAGLRRTPVVLRGPPSGIAELPAASARFATDGPGEASQVSCSKQVAGNGPSDGVIDRNLSRGAALIGCS